MFNKGELLKAVKEEERVLFARAIDRAALAVKTFEPQFSDFMDPFKMAQLSEICRGEHNFGLNPMIWGGCEGTERCIMGFFPDFTEPDPELFPISCIKMSYNGKFSRQLTHRDYLGSVLGLGISREKTGDIFIEDDCAYMFMDKDVASFVVSSLERVGHTKVKTDFAKDYKRSAEEGTEKRFTVASLRLDAVLSGAFNISRGRIAELIKGEKAFVNWQSITSAAHTVSQGDMLTLRGTGRVMIKEICGITKKDRVALVAEIYK